jgi:hypothetical protein
MVPRLSDENQKRMKRLLCRRDGVPNVMVMDGAKEQTLSDFREEVPRRRSAHQTDGTVLAMDDGSREQVRRPQEGISPADAEEASPSDCGRDNCLELRRYSLSACW